MCDFVCCLHVLAVANASGSGYFMFSAALLAAVVSSVVKSCCGKNSLVDPKLEAHDQLTRTEFFDGLLCAAQSLAFCVSKRGENERPKH